MRLMSRGYANAWNIVDRKFGFDRLGAAKNGAGWAVRDSKMEECFTDLVTTNLMVDSDDTLFIELRIHSF